MSKHRYKFQNLDVYKLGLQYLENVYELTSSFPDQEKYNLRSQLERALMKCLSWAIKYL